MAELKEEIKKVTEAEPLDRLVAVVESIDTKLSALNDALDRNFAQLTSTSDKVEKAADDVADAADDVADASDDVADAADSIDNLEVSDYFKEEL